MKKYALELAESSRLIVMSQSQISPISLPERIEILDVLRGLAVCGILVGNVQWFSGYG